MPQASRQPGCSRRPGRSGGPFWRCPRCRCARRAAPCPRARSGSATPARHRLPRPRPGGTRQTWTRSASRSSPRHRSWPRTGSCSPTRCTGRSPAGSPATGQATCSAAGGRTPIIDTRTGCRSPAAPATTPFGPLLCSHPAGCGPASWRPSSRCVRRLAAGGGAVTERATSSAGCRGPTCCSRPPGRSRWWPRNCASPRAGGEAARPICRFVTASASRWTTF